MTVTTESSELSDPEEALGVLVCLTLLSGVSLVS